VHLYLLEVNRPFESWLVLGRTGGAYDRIGWDEIGLDPKKRWAVFEYWERRALPDADALSPGALPQPFNSQAFVIRERRPHPQVLATSRHVTGGGVDLIDVAWADQGVLSGRSRVVGGEPYEIYVTEPTGWQLTGVECEGAASQPVSRREGYAIAACVPSAGGDLTWRATFSRQ
jgi:hypothetical protein